LDGWGLIPNRGNIFLYSPPRPDRLWGQTFFLSNGSSFLGGKAAGTWSWPVTSICCRGQEWWSYTYTPTNVFLAWWLIS
jgi:hypothetical protein